MTKAHGKRRKSLWKTLLPLVIVGALAIGSLVVIKRSLSPSGTLSAVKAGQKIPEFELSSFPDRTTRTLSSIPAKLKLVNFWASWCSSCMIEIPSIVKLYEKYRAHGFEIIMVNMDEDPDAVVPGIVARFGLGSTVYLDPEGKAADVFNIHAIPVTALIDGEGKVLEVIIGERDWSSPEEQKKVESYINYTAMKSGK